MGKNYYSIDDWKKYSVTTSSMDIQQIFTQKGLHDDLNPLKFTIRESRDSVNNPLSTPIVIGLDVTGSMGDLAELIVKKGLGPIFEKLIEKKVVAYPHVCYMGIGDELYDKSPYQMTQYETEITLAAPQIEKIHLEGGGGGNHFESYIGAWLLAHRKTNSDNWEKRGKKGFIITIGDERPTKLVSAEYFSKYTGIEISQNLSPQEVLKEVSTRWNVFHILVAEGNYCRQHGIENVGKEWAEVLGENIWILDKTKHLPTFVTNIINKSSKLDPEIESLLDI